MIRVLLIALVMMASVGCSSKEKIEVPKNTKAGPTSPPITLGN